MLLNNQIDRPNNVSLSSSHEKAKVELTIFRDFLLMFDFFQRNLPLVRNHQAEVSRSHQSDCEAFYPRAQQLDQDAG